MPVQGSESGESKSRCGLSVEKMCQVAAVSRAGYYRNYAEHCPVEEEMLVRSTIQKIVVEHRRRYGYRRVWFELNQKLGMVVNHKRVLRLMRDDNLLALQRKQFVMTTDSNHTLEIALNLARRMQLTAVNQLWVADITYIQVWGEFVFSSGGVGRVLAQGGGLGAEPEVEQWPGDQSAGEGDSGTAAVAGNGASFRPRVAVRESRVCSLVGETADGGEHESSGQSV